MTDPILQVENLNVWFDLGGDRRMHPVRGISYEVHEREWLTLVGESGCGKTTAILAALGLLSDNASISGQVKLGGQDILHGGEQSVRGHRWTDLALIPQGAMNAFNPVLTIGDQLVEPIRVHSSTTRRAAANRALELLELVGVPRDRFTRYAHELSGGMRQRAAIAMALTCNPKVLLADEPTTALDAVVQAQVLGLLDTIRKELSTAIVMVTHDLPIAGQFADRAAVMYAGRIVEAGSVDDLYHDPAHPYTRMLFGAMPTLHSSTRANSIPGNPPRLDLELEGCSFASRCDSTLAVCDRSVPASTVLDPHRTVECHLRQPDRTER